MRSPRRCSRNGCPKSPVATLTYVYAESMAVVGPLAAFAEPHSYDLCEAHAVRLTAPRGWDLVRHDGEFGPPQPTNDDLVALADAVREAGRPVARPDGRTDRDGRPGRDARPDVQPRYDRDSGPRPAASGGAGPVGRRGHLRVIPPER